MTEKKKITTSLELYDELSKIYSSPYPDNEAERTTGQRLLALAVKNEKVTPDEMCEKMRELAEVKSNFKSKLYSEIVSKFWNKSFNQSITYKPFKIE